MGWSVRPLGFFRSVGPEQHSSLSRHVSFQCCAAVSVHDRDLARDHAVVNDADPLGRAKRQVQNPAVDERTAIVDPDVHAASTVLHADRRAERQRPVCSRKAILVEQFAVGGYSVSVVIRTVTGFDCWKSKCQVRTYTIHIKLLYTIYWQIIYIYIAQLNPSRAVAVRRLL